MRSLEDLVANRVCVALTGAGMSTDSGIPDYRGPNARPIAPITYQQFISDFEFRQRYWARNHVGWQQMWKAEPNAGHYAMAELEKAGVIHGLITQNVDRLHVRAGSQNLIELHGHFEDVLCLECRMVIPRDHLHTRLSALNVDFAPKVLQWTPDADAEIGDSSSFVIADCEDCGGMLKPDIVYFGESVPAERVQRAFQLVDEAEVLLVAGSSLTVMSGFRFVKHAAKHGKDIVIINRGPTRGDELATLKIDAGTSETLSELAKLLVSAKN